jgi:hypothetical protein
MVFDDKAYYLKNREIRLARAKAWNKANAERLHKRQRERMRRFKGMVFAHYGMECACCGESEEAFLTIDHLKKNGKEHRKMTGLGTAFYKWIVDFNYPDDLRILCMNCNYGERRREHCPHLTNKQTRANLVESLQEPGD